MALNDQQFQNRMLPIVQQRAAPGGGGGQPNSGGVGQMPGLLQMMMQGGGGGNPFGGIWGAGQSGGGGGGGNPFARIWGGAGQRGFGGGGGGYLGYPQFQGQNTGMSNSLPPGLLQMMMQRQGQGQQYDPNWGNTQAMRSGSPADYLQRGNDWAQRGIDSANAGLNNWWNGVS